MNNDGKIPIKVLKKKKTINLKIIICIFFILFTFIISVLLIPKFFISNIEKIKDSIVMIYFYDESDNYLGVGSGFCAYKSNYIVTNFHVVENAYRLEIITDDKKIYDVNDVVIFDAENDLAILDTDVDLKPLKIGKSNDLKAGTSVTAIGSPQGVLNTVSKGIISNADENHIRIDAPISRGSSGGVLLNRKNEVIGITNAVHKSSEAQNINFAIRVEKLTDLYNSYEKEKYELLTIDDYDRCMSLDSNQLEFKMCYNSYYQYYSSNNHNTFYEITNHQNRYDYKMNYSYWKDLYDEFSQSEKELALSYFKIFIDTDFCEDDCNIENDIDNWDISDFMINLDILEKNELAFVLVDLNRYDNDNQKFDRVIQYKIDPAEKVLILYLIGDISWENIQNDDKESVFDYFDERYKTNDFGSILEILGYDVEYNLDGTLTASW